MSLILHVAGLAALVLSIAGFAGLMWSGRAGRRPLRPDAALAIEIEVPDGWRPQALPAHSVETANQRESSSVSSPDFNPAIDISLDLNAQQVQQAVSRLSR